MEMQVQPAESGEGFQWVVTLCAGRSTWTSKPGSLSATDWDGAVTEATGQARILARCLGLAAT